MAESMIIEEALAALQQRLHALAEPAAVAMKATGSLMHHLDSALVPVVLVSRALAIGAVLFSPATKTSDMRKREEEIAKGLEYEVGTIGTDIVMLQEDIKLLRDEAKGVLKKEGQLVPVKEVLTKVESAFNAMVNRSHDVRAALEFIGPHLAGILGKFNDEITVVKVKQLLAGLNYKEAMGPYQYLMYMRCLALQLSAIKSASTGDVVTLARAFTSFNDDLVELHQWLRDLEEQHFLKNNCRIAFAM